MSDEPVEYQQIARHANFWHVDGLPSAWFEATNEFVNGKRGGIPQFENPLHVTVTIEVEEFDEDRVRECETIGGTVSRHRCEDCESCLIRKRTVEAELRFFECPDCGWITIEILR